jgi:hypothetical protein
MQEEIAIGAGEELPGQTFLLQEASAGSSGTREVSLVPS